MATAAGVLVYMALFLTVMGVLSEMDSDRNLAEVQYQIDKRAADSKAAEGWMIGDGK